MRCLRWMLMAALLLGAAGCDVPETVCGETSCSCRAQQTCTFDTCDQDCQLDCQAQSDCLADLGQGSAVTCAGATCAITVADDSTVDCQKGAVCNVACSGTCTVDCAAGAQCFLSCGGDTPAPLTAEQGECP